MEAMLQGESTSFRGSSYFYYVHLDRGSFGASLLAIFCIIFKYSL